MTYQSDQDLLEHLYSIKIALKRNGGVISPYYDYQETANEMARQLAVANFDMDYVYRNLVSVWQEHTLVNTCDRQTEYFQCYSTVVYGFKQYCEYVRTQGGKPDPRVTQVQYPNYETGEDALGC